MITAARFLLIAAFFSTSLHSYGEATNTAKLYEKLTINCSQCHANPKTGAPIIGNAEQWSDVMSKDKETVLRNIYLGINGMPPLGYCSSCSTEDFLKLTKIMMGLPISSQPISSQSETVNGSWVSELENKGKHNEK